MPTNVTPEYRKAEAAYRAARGPEERIARLEEMIALLPKHKGTDHLFADLKSRLSKLQEQQEEARRKGKGGSTLGFAREGAAQVVLVGPPNSGKSSLRRQKQAELFIRIDMGQMKKIDHFPAGAFENIVQRPVDSACHLVFFCKHAFDADKIDGKKVVIKNLPDKSKFITLDGVERSLSSKDLMICNDSEGMCIAGVFGGIKSGVTENTTNIFLESAYFNPVSIRKTSKRHGLKTDASFRFERGADPEITEWALKRASMLIKEIAGGKIF